MKRKDEYKDMSDEDRSTILSVSAIIFAIAFALLLLTSCRSPRNLNTTTIQKQDSTHTEVREKIVYVPDTVFFEIPAQTAERTTRDTTSFLENDYAESNARINPDGSLYHDLKTKPQEKPVPFDKPVERKDSIVYRNKYVEVPVPVEKELSWWEQTCIKWFPYSLVALFVVLAWTFRSPLKKLINFIRCLI